jgi:hypothetical protein
VVRHGQVVTHVWYRHTKHRMVLVNRFDELGVRVLEAKADLHGVALDEVRSVDVHTVSLALGNCLGLLSLFGGLLCLFFFTLLDLLFCDLFWEFFDRLLGLPSSFFVFWRSIRCSKLTNIGQSFDTAVVVVEFESINPLLIVECQLNVDYLFHLRFWLRLSYSRSFLILTFSDRGVLLFLLLLLFSIINRLIFFLIEQPAISRHRDSQRLELLIPISSNLTEAFAIFRGESDALRASIIQSFTNNLNVSATERWSKVWLDSLDLNVVVSEIDWFARELLAVERNIHVV